MNVYGSFKFSTVRSISQYDTLQSIMNIPSSLYMTQLAGKELNEFQQLAVIIDCIRVILVPNWGQNMLYTKN